MQSHPIIRLSEPLSDSDAAQLKDLFAAVWPPAPQNETSAEETAPKQPETREGLTHFVVRENGDSGEIRAHAAIFRREIVTSDGPLWIGALAGVCVHPQDRGKGWGAQVARAALEYLPALNVEVSLFQTPVPQFYEKLDCRVIDNSFHNGADAKDPFWEPIRMIYPSAFNWPSGAIDLNGVGY